MCGLCRLLGVGGTMTGYGVFTAFGIAGTILTTFAAFGILPTRTAELTAWHAILTMGIVLALFGQFLSFSSSIKP